MKLWKSSSHMVRPISKAESHLSMGAGRSVPSVIRGDYLINRDDDNSATFIYPHLQVNN